MTSPQAWSEMSVSEWESAVEESKAIFMNSVSTLCRRIKELEDEDAPALRRRIKELEAEDAPALRRRIEELEDAPTKRRRVDSNPNSLLDAADSIDRIASLVKYYEGLDEFTFDESTFLEHDGDVLYHNESLSTIAASIRNRRLEANL